MADGPNFVDASALEGMSAVVEQIDVIPGPRAPFKVGELVRWRGDVARDEAAERFRDGQRGLAVRVPGLRRHWLNLVVGAVGSVGVVDEPVGFDGLVEWWFDDQAAYEAALRTPEWEALRAARAAFVDEDALPAAHAVVEERVIRE